MLSEQEGLTVEQEFMMYKYFMCKDLEVSAKSCRKELKRNGFWKDDNKRNVEQVLRGARKELKRLERQIFPPKDDE